MSEKSVTRHIRAHLLDSLSYHEPVPDLAQLRLTQWSNSYERYRRNRMVMGFFRYGDIRRDDLDKYDLPREAIRRIRRYERDRNLEHLVDAGNMCMLAFIQGERNGERMESIDDGEHAKKS